MKPTTSIFAFGVIANIITRALEHLHPYLSDLAAIATIVATGFAAYAQYRKSQASAAEERLSHEREIAEHKRNHSDDNE